MSYWNPGFFRDKLAYHFGSNQRIYRPGEIYITAVHRKNGPCYGLCRQGQGAKVYLVTGPTELEDRGVEVVKVVTTEEMLDACMSLLQS